MQVADSNARQIPGSPEKTKRIFKGYRVTTGLLKVLPLERGKDK